MRWLLAACVVLSGCRSPRKARGVEVKVIAAWPGANAEAMAISVTTPLERALARLPNVRAMTSESTPGAVTITLELAGVDNPLEADSRVGAAASPALQLLPPSMTTLPALRAALPLVGRYVIAPADAELAERELLRLPGIGAVDACGGLQTEQSVEVDPARLAAMELAVGDVINALREQKTGEVADAVIATRNGVSLRVRDVATVAMRRVPTACVAISATGPICILEIRATNNASLERARASIADEARGGQAHLVPAPPARELHGDLPADADLGKLADTLHAALAPAGAPYLIELREGHLRAFTSTDAVAAALQPAVASLGVATTTVHVESADPIAAAHTAEAIIERLRTRKQYVGSRGLATARTVDYDIDREAAAHLGVTLYDLEQALASRDGMAVSRVFTQNDSYPVVVRTPDVQQLSVHGSDRLVPISALVHVQERSAPAEIVHRGQFPAVDIEAHGDAHGVLKGLAVPAGVRVTFDQG